LGRGVGIENRLKVVFIDGTPYHAVLEVSLMFLLGATMRGTADGLP
jgi:hypothetical protein